MEKFKDIYKGQTIWIVGKGPSLQYLIKEDIGSGPVITINEAIVKVEEVGLSNPVYSMQKDGGERRQYWRVLDKFQHGMLIPDCDYTPDCGDSCGKMRRPKQGATLLVHEHESLYCMPDYSPRYIFEWEEFGLRHNNISFIMAMEIGILMGCKKFCFVSFDVHVNGSFQAYTPGVGLKQGKYKDHKRRIRSHLVDLDYRWITPTKRKAK